MNELTTARRFIVNCGKHFYNVSGFQRRRSKNAGTFVDSTSQLALRKKSFVNKVSRTCDDSTNQAKCIDDIAALPLADAEHAGKALVSHASTRIHNYMQRNWLRTNRSRCVTFYKDLKQSIGGNGSLRFDSIRWWFIYHKKKQHTKGIYSCCVLS